MKLRHKNHQGSEMVPPQVKLTDDEILADLVYPTPLFSRGEENTDEYERIQSR